MVAMKGHRKDNNKMPRGQYSRKSKEGIAGITTTQALIPVSAFTDAAWWAKLNNEEQTAVQSLGQKLASAMLQYGTSRLAIGEYLAGLQSVLEPHNLFGRMCAAKRWPCPPTPTQLTYALSLKRNSRLGKFKVAQAVTWDW